LNHQSALKRFKQKFSLVTTISLFFFAGINLSQTTVTKANFILENDTNISTSFNSKAGESLTNPIDITLGLTMGSFNGSLDDYYYRIYLAVSYGLINFSLTGENETDFDLIIYDPNKDPYAGSMNPTSQEELITNLSIDGYWFIRIRRFIGYGNFNLTVSLYVPEFTSETPSSTPFELGIGLIVSLIIIGVLFTGGGIYIGIIFIKRKKQEVSSAEKRTVIETSKSKTDIAEELIEKPKEKEKKERIIDKEKLAKELDEKELSGYSFTAKDENE